MFIYILSCHSNAGDAKDSEEMHVGNKFNMLFKFLKPVQEHFSKCNEAAQPFLTCVHLPHVDGAIRATNHQVVVGRTPLDDLDGEEVSRGQHDALPLPETKQADGVVAGHRADAVLHPSLRVTRRQTVKSKHLARTA